MSSLHRGSCSSAIRRPPAEAAPRGWAEAAPKASPPAEGRLSSLTPLGMQTSPPATWRGRALLFLTHRMTQDLSLGAVRAPPTGCQLSWQAVGGFAGDP
jgi:hypothetical protein